MTLGCGSARGRAAGVVLVALATLVVTALPLASATTVQLDPATKPNIVVVMTDDLSWAELSYLPSVQRLLVDQGRTFPNYLVSVPVCCPSRVTMFRGQYAHNTGVLRNVGEAGGFTAAHDAGLEAGMLGPRMQAAGYTTALFGRYLNGYPGALPLTYVPPGWDAWAVAVRSSNAVLDYTLNENGSLVDYGSDPSDYITDVQFDHAVDFIQHRAPDEPFLVWLNPYAPHAPSIPAERHAGSAAGLAAPKPPNFNEADVSDKPAYVQAAPAFGASRSALIDETFRHRVESLQAVDENVARLLDVLETSGHLDDTLVLFSSDNGFHLGNHRLLPGKGSPYEEDVRVPFVVRGPGVPAGSSSDALIGNVDLLPTLLALAGVGPDENLDGRDASAELRGTAPTTRSLYLLEHWQKDLDLLGSTDPDEETGVVELTPGGDASIPDFHGFRTKRWKYIRYATGEVELYDLVADPGELTNVAGLLPPAKRSEADALADALASCSGATCRALEDAPPPLPLNLLVDTTDDLDDGAPGDGRCGTGAPGSCSLRAAIIETNAQPGLDVVTVPAGTYRLTRTGPGEDSSRVGDLDVTEDLTIRGRSATIIGDGSDRVLDVHGGALSAADLTIVGGVAQRNGTRPGSGGGVAVAGSATFAATRLDVRDSTATDLGGGIALSAGATLRGEDLTLTGNRAAAGGGIGALTGSVQLNGGAVQLNRATNGGGVITSGSLSMHGVTIADNRATAGSGGGVFGRGGSLNISDSVFLGNDATASAGALVAASASPGNAIVRSAFVDNVAGTQGGAIVTADTSVEIASTTFARNRGSTGGALYIGRGAATIPDAVRLTDTTVVDNDGSGITVDGTGASIGNSIVADQRSGPGCAGTGRIASTGTNLTSDASCAFDRVSDLLAAAQLDDRSGVSGTEYVPSALSPAVDSGAGCSALDQRRFRRPYGGSCDRGAIERAGTPALGLGGTRNYLGTGRGLPGAWRENISLAIGGGCTSKERGDRFSSRSDHNTGASPDGSGTFQSCEPGNPASVEPSTDHRPTGYEFLVQVPPGFHVGDRLFLDAQGLASCAANDPIGPPQTPTATVVTIARDEGLAGRTVISGPKVIDQTTDGGAWCGDPNSTVQSGPASTWRQLAAIDPAPGDQYVITVATSEPTDATREQGINVFALRTRARDTFVPCSIDPAGAGADPGCVTIRSVGGHAFHLERAELGALLDIATIGPQHQGRTLQLEMWDPGDQLDFLELRDPTGRRVPITVEVACQDGSYPSERGRPCAAESPPATGYGPMTTNRMSFGGAAAFCANRPAPTVQGCALYNDRLVRITSPLPDDITGAYSGATMWRAYVRTTGVPSPDVETWTISIR